MSRCAGSRHVLRSPLTPDRLVPEELHTFKDAASRGEPVQAAVTACAAHAFAPPATRRAGTVAPPLRNMSIWTRSQGVSRRSCRAPDAWHATSRRRARRTQRLPQLPLGGAPCTRRRSLIRPDRQDTPLADQAPAESEGHRMGPVGRAELFEQPTGVRLDRVLGEEQLTADLRVGPA